MRRDRGSIAPAIPIVVLALLLLGGLVVDGSRQLIARGEAQAYAEEAARAGATAVDLSANDLTLLPDVALDRVRSYCADVQAQNEAVIECRAADPAITEVGGGDDRRLVVHTVVRLRVSATLLGLVGFQALTASGSAKARPVEGLTGADAQ